MIDVLAPDMLSWIGASSGWAAVAARAALKNGPAPDPASPEPRPVRLRATITIDIDARDAEEARRETLAVQALFETLKGDHPGATLGLHRRRPRLGRRSPPPSLVVTSYVDD